MHVNGDYFVRHDLGLFLWPAANWPIEPFAPDYNAYYYYCSAPRQTAADHFVAGAAPAPAAAVVGVQLNMQTASNVSRLDRVQSQIASSLKLALFISICLLAQPHTDTHSHTHTHVDIEKFIAKCSAVRRHWVANR